MVISEAKEREFQLMNDPLVSVLLPVYNAEKFLRESIQSILDQTYINLELLIFDDGSTDKTRQIASQFSQSDSRIRLFTEDNNQGIVSALNRGLESSKGKYIARMDADDICLPPRIEKQVEYLELNPEIGLLGCRIQYIDEYGKLTLLPDFSFHGDVEIRWNLNFLNPFYHPTVMFRKSIIEKNELRYDPHAIHVEDYELWGRYLMFSKGENLPEILLHYRIHSDSVGSIHGCSQNRLAAKISSEIINNHMPNINVSPLELNLWLSTQWGLANMPYNRRSQLMHVYLKIWHAFELKNKGSLGLKNLKKKVVSWAAVMSLYPLFQPELINSLRLLFKIEWRWPIYTLFKLPYYYKNRQNIESIRK